MNSIERFYGIKLEAEEELINLSEWILHENYLSKKAPLLARIPFIHPHMIPEWLRRKVSFLIKSKKTAKFPNFPGDFSVDYMRKLMLGNKKHVPFWPNNKKFAILLTHDVDSDLIFRDNKVLKSFLKIEENLSFRSAWYFVTHKYRLDHKQISKLQKAGHEIGFHGDIHDYRLAFLKQSKMRKRLERCKEFIENYNVKGGRSPAFLRTPAFLEVLGELLSYDTSFHDATIGAMTGKPEGCCSCFPFFEGNLLEIPTTITEELILQSKGYSTNEIIAAQLKKARQIAELGGVIMVLTHPEKGISANKQGIYIYKKLLEGLKNMQGSWSTLPRELDAHWRKRDTQILHN